MIKIIIVDDHSIMRSGLAKILKEEPDMEVVCEADGYLQLMEALQNDLPDVVLLDITMPGKNGLDVLKELRADYPEVKVLILSMHPEDRFSVRAIKGGASGYINKESATEELVNAIRKVSSGGKFITPVVAEILADSFEQDTSKPLHDKLSDREFQILRMITSGKKVKEIADELFLSPATVATYRSRILEKMHMRSNVELTNYVLRNNLIE
ncbi:response regulator [Marinoscillum furvescens]|uniref:LuxR family two component transcriptional regulator n=1 Tax=Marinoscillum furvescens DSM 4134 TaxID=1122208 RepID=A0A3D9L0U9_MARFU|nr:response regulator transcription factor [Marinoscillum furvescens]RED97086.1 LuxR family two component transcriptional regulator [Marinoscillum furvescens DSM 4134]